MAGEGGVAAFGEALRREREERGVALESICNATKVPVKHFLALEAGAFAELPGGVFRRGFVRSYLSALGLEETYWMQRFEESCRASGLKDTTGGDEWAKFAENVKNNRGVARRRMGGWWVRRLTLVVLLAVAAWCGWRLATHRTVLPPARVFRTLKSWVDNAPSR
jgi:cytoskeletal protein RodZ